MEGIKSKDKKNDKNQKSRIKKSVIIGVLVLVVSGFSINYFNNTYIYSDTIAKNIFIEDIDVSEQTKDNAINLVLEKYAPKNIVLNYDDKSYEIAPDKIDLSYNIESVVNEAFDYTKTESYFDNLKRYFDLNKNNRKYEIKASYDETKLSEEINKVQNDIYVEVVDAKVWVSDAGTMSYAPSTQGKELDIQSTKEAIYNMIANKSFTNINLKVNTKEPKMTTEQAKSVDTLLASYTTKFSTNDPNRVQNIRIASNRTSNILLMPGEEFSYNNLTGRRTLSNGYKDAPVIVNGVIEDGVGGGVCQVSTTIFNTALYSGMDITSRRNHSLKSSYVPIGQDAMVSDGGSDFRFKNPYNNPVVVKTTVGNGTVSSKIYGNSSDKKNITVRVDPFRENGLEAAKTYVQYRDKNGEVINTKYISKSVYKKPKK
ncbi:MAG: VanW family protein [Peptostreptococcaceae bacterium]